MADLTPEDVARLRANIEKHGPPPLSPMLIFMLMGALEAAWAERDEAQEADTAATTLLMKERERAEQAERDRDYYIRELARIGDQNVHMSASLARVKALCDEEDFEPSCMCCVPVVDVADVRAAIEGDNQ